MTYFLILLLNHYYISQQTESLCLRSIRYNMDALVFDFNTRLSITLAVMFMLGSIAGLCVCYKYNVWGLRDKVLGANRI